MWYVHDTFSMLASYSVLSGCCLVLLEYSPNCIANVISNTFCYADACLH